MIARELRSLADSPSSIPAAYRDRLRMLAAEADALAAQTAVTGELDVTAAGLDPEQTIRARAALAAATALAPALANANSGISRDALLHLTVDLAELIRTGARPGARPGAICTCRRERSIAEPGQPLMEVRNPDCPLHGNRLESSA